MAAFNGNILELPDIAVDNFTITKRAYFLSHCHTDHTTGLETLHKKFIGSSTFPNIYMTEESAAIVASEKKKNKVEKRYSEITDYIIPLRPGRTEITLPGDEESDIEETNFWVTLIPTDHCFGAVMFLFETDSKKVLYTGDIRVSPDNFENIPYIHDDDGRLIQLDVLYVDTTFQDLAYTNFPERSETTDHVIQTIEEWLDKDESNGVALCPAAWWGYEYVVNEIFNRLNINVGLQAKNWDVYSLFPDQVPGVTNKASQVHLCKPCKQVCDCEYNKDGLNMLSIKLKAWDFKDFEPEDHVPPSDNKLKVCYSTHCSSSELIHFVNRFRDVCSVDRPLKIVGFKDPYIHDTSNDVTGFVDDSGFVEDDSVDEIDGLVSQLRI